VVIGRCCFGDACLPSMAMADGVKVMSARQVADAERTREETAAALRRLNGGGDGGGDLDVVRDNRADAVRAAITCEAVSCNGGAACWSWAQSKVTRFMALEARYHHPMPDWRCGHAVEEHLTTGAPPEHCWAVQKRPSPVDFHRLDT
jgi:hypothetical protein